MKLSKYAAIVMTVALGACALTGCGSDNSSVNFNENFNENNNDVEISVDSELETEDTDISDNDVTSDAPSADGTVAERLSSAFEAELLNSQDITKVAEALIKNDAISELGMVTMSVEEGYLDGFDDEISGFNNAVKFSPMIGSIPFVGYIFETEDTDSLVSSLKEHAQLNWNICTAADEMLVTVKDNYVFFVMSPKTF